MSRSFTQRPSFQTRGRGNITRGRGTNAAVHPVTVRPAQQRSLYGTSPTRGSWATDQNQDAQQDIDGPYSQPRNVADDPSRGEFRGAYTVFAPDERRRQKVSQMAQKETQEYAQHKAASASVSFNFIGTVGGEMSKDQARRKQAESVQDQKYNRLQRQQQYKDESKRREEMEIEQKRAEARKKAEKNALREQARIANPEDLRQKREQFLNRLENKQL